MFRGGSQFHQVPQATRAHAAPVIVVRTVKKVPSKAALWNLKLSGLSALCEVERGIDPGEDEREDRRRRERTRMDVEEPQAFSEYAVCWCHGKGQDG